MPACPHVCMPAHNHASMPAHNQVSMPAHLHATMPACPHARMPACRVPACPHARMPACPLARMHARTPARTLYSVPGHAAARYAGSSSNRIFWALRSTTTMPRAPRATTVPPRPMSCHKMPHQRLLRQQSSIRSPMQHQATESPCSGAWGSAAARRRRQGRNRPSHSSLIDRQSSAACYGVFATLGCARRSDELLK